jgi:DNA polymerase sigma
MGARINFVFKDGTTSNVVLYSHWGQDSWQPDLAEALVHARPRMTDSSYGTRMIISYLIQHNILDETGFGIYSINSDNYDLGEQTVVIDFANQTVIDNVPVKFDAFVNAYGPQVLTEHAVV